MVIGVVGYGLLIFEGVGLGLLLGPWWPEGISLMLIWYGLYFGVLGRDLAEVAGDRMVRHVHQQASPSPPTPRHALGPHPNLQIGIIIQPSRCACRHCHASCSCTSISIPVKAGFMVPCCMRHTSSGTSVELTPAVCVDNICQVDVLMSVS